ncbi:ThiF family adenylyltransferase [Rhodococcus erythropolis]|jgi:hypothetical protein|uniref:ThiF family adenylyltransferase n=1 Tax=Rhodococcus TaxID=1827 RepID=UPI001BA50B1B|nr:MULTISPECIES: ThiF family adenylyltransferase [Rhodococcus]MBS2993025.1 ThiF family adenylyltransferase [Rhodococcus erythropolis]MDV8128529.1 ThiF family adenylyltransferase [Rhodococcus sp. IEGM 1304]
MIEASRASWLDRNSGLISSEQQELLDAATVLVAGVGGVGGRVAEVLARMGVGRLKLTDPDHFSPTNLNRQAACTSETLGKNKAEVVAELCRIAAPGVIVLSNPDGVTAENVAELLDDVDVVIDGTDYLHPELGILIAQQARRRGIPVVLGVEVGYSVWATSYLSTASTFEEMFGYKRDCAPFGVKAAPLWRWIVSVPRYVRLSELRRLARGEIQAPAIAPAVELSAAVLSTMVCQLLWGQRPQAAAPRLFRIDLMTGRSRVTRHSRVRFALSLVAAVLTH